MAFKSDLLEIDDKIINALSTNPIKGAEEDKYKFIKAMFKGENGIAFVQLGEKTVEIDGNIKKVYGLDDFSMEALNRTRKIKHDLLPMKEVDLKGKSITIMIPPYETIIEIAKIQVKFKKILLLNNGDLLLGEIIAYLSWLPDMSNLYKMYKRNPDLGVDFVSKDVYMKYIKEKGVGKRAVAKDACYTSEMICIACVIVLAMVKPTYNIFNEWLPYTKCIIRDLGGHLGAEGSTITYDYILSKFSSISIEQFSQKIANYPEFKSLVFTLVLQSVNPIMIHIKENVKESCMTIFSIISQFITAPQLTELHIDPRIYSDLICCREILNKLKNMYGDLWPFYKLLNPNGAIISKTFESAALAWYSVSNNSEILKNTPELKINEEFVRLSRQPLSDKASALGVKLSLDSRVTDLMNIFEKKFNENGELNGKGGAAGEESEAD